MLLQKLAMIPCFKSTEIAARRCFRNLLMIQAWISNSPQSRIPAPSTDPPCLSCHASGLRPKL